MTDYWRLPGHWPTAGWGDAVVRVIGDADGAPVDIVVLDAAPRVLVSGALVRACGKPDPGPLPRFMYLRDECLTLRSPSSTLVYRLVDYDPAQDVWWGQWPD